ncbi:MAG: ABC transporter ATP-binding protein [Blautia sp.]|nr:ABC transporter ATP-binding protein [Blautia sp.]
MTDKTVIKVEELTKLYKLYEKPSDRLREALGLSRKKRYTEHYALRHVSFSVKEGECVGIIGTNGSGKSTLLKIITGVLAATEGTVEVDGRISALLELGAGFNMEYTGIENIHLNGAMLGFSSDEIEKRLPAILSFADIGEFVYQPVKTYSSGMFVRLAFALAINIEPEILIVDEALSVGDVFFQAKCFHKFEEFKSQGKTILFVSHDLSSVSKYCDRVILLDRGVKRGEGTAKAMVDAYKQLLVGTEIREASEEAAAPLPAAENTFVLNPEVLSYGEKQAEIIDIRVLDDHDLPTNTIQKGSVFHIRVTVCFHQAVDEPIVAFTFKDVRGTEITGTNTMFEKKEKIIAKPGECCTVTFTQRMDLQGGEYLLSFGCTGFRDGEFTVYHRLYDACNITVVSEKNTVGFFDMNSQITIIQGETYADWKSKNR